MSMDAKSEVAVFPKWPCFEEDEIEATERVLRSGKVNYWTGQEGRCFETEFAEYVGAEHGLAVANGTLAIEIVLRGLGIGDGDEVVTTPRTFYGTTSAIMMTGARPVFADVDLDSGNITAETIEAVLTPRTKAILPVHLAGWPCDMESIMELADAKGLYVIEDCAQAHGAKIKGRSVGTFGIAGAWSFCQDKIITTGGEGGMVTTNDEQLWKKMWSFKDHGKNYDTVYNKQHPPGFRWLHEDVGTNWRMTEMQSAIGRVQLRKLDQWVAQRQANAEVLARRFADVPWLRVPSVPAEYEHAYYRFYALVEQERLEEGLSRDLILSAVAMAGVPIFSGSCCEVYREKAFDGDGLRPESRLPNAKCLTEDSLCFLTHPTLDERHMDAVVNAVEQAVGLASPV